MMFINQRRCKVKMYKLICLDLDGTLLASDCSITEKNLSTLKVLMEKGVKVAVATGRSAENARYFALKLGEKAFFLGNNGTVVGIAGKKEYLSQHKIGYEKVKGIFKIANDIGANTIFVSENTLFFNNQEEYDKFITHKDSWELVNEKSVFFKDEERFLDEIAKDKINIYKCMLFNSKNKSFEEIRRILEKNGDYELYFLSGGYFEIIDSNANKSKGIMVLEKHLGINKEDIIAFGDSENDVSMIEYVGHGVAMGNAVEHVKDVASATTKTNDEDGVAHYLERVYVELINA